MSEYQFVASTVEAEKKMNLLGSGALLLPAIVMLVLFKGMMPHVITNQGVLWLVIVVPSVVCFSTVMRFLQKHYVGKFSIRLDGRHVTLVHPDRTVTDLGEMQRVSLDFSSDYKRADLSLCGSKDGAMLRLRSATTWNGHSSAKDFTMVDKAAADIQAMLERKAAA